MIKGLIFYGPTFWVPAKYSGISGARSKMGQLSGQPSWPPSALLIYYAVWTVNVVLCRSIPFYNRDGLTQDFIDGPHYISIVGETGENNAIISHSFIFFTPLLNLVYNQGTFCFVFNWGGIKPRRSPSEWVRPSPFMLAWVTNVSTSPNLYIEFSTGY